MHPSDIVQLNNQLKRYYGDRYAGLTNDMATLWYEELKCFPYELAVQALKRWVADHLPHQPPTLAQLTNQMEDLRLEQRRQRAAEGVREPSDSWGERDDSYSSEEVRALIRSVWPDVFPEHREMKDEDRATRMARLREQAMQILREEADASRER